MVTGVIIPADIDSAPRLQEFHGLRDYQTAVGGLIEAIDLDSPPMSFFANEEAKLIGLPINQRANALWWLHVPAAYGFDFLAGDVVLIGRPDEEGETQDAPPEFVRLLLGPATYRVEVQTADSGTAWSGNGRRFSNYFAAATYAIDLSHRWTLVTATRVVAA